MTSVKITKKIFLDALRANAGLYSRTARFINKTYGIKISRQAVFQRAQKYPGELQDIQEENIDLAEEGLHGLMRSSNEQVRFRAIELFLKTKGRHRGYQSNIDLNIDFEKLSDDQLELIVNQLLQKIKT